MNQHLQNILDILQQIESISDDQKALINKSLKDADKELVILAFKLDRTEKVKRTTAILLGRNHRRTRAKKKSHRRNQYCIDQIA
jgi:two-component system, NtrC family, sensor kinase